MMRTVDEIIRTIISDVEKGFVDDPDDPGGPTNHGVSLRYARGLGLDLDGDGDTDRDDILLVSAHGALMYFKQDFYYSPGIHRLPEELRPVMIDMAINHGPARALMILQEVVNRVTFGDDLLYVDGRLGPATRRASEKAYEHLGGDLINAICDAREAFYYSLADINPGRFMKYVITRDGGIGGWIKRAQSFKVPL